ncbi:MAG: hypothetical protein CL917_15790 [Deltaproteobacteria bacterium]|nr:hypothetical protein [Deltaproteobacteria bacterium]
MEDVDPGIDEIKATLHRACQSPLYKARLCNVKIKDFDDFHKLPLTTREDLQSVDIHGTRAVPLERVCHYGETSGTSGKANSTWLTTADFTRNAQAIAARHPDVFSAGRILLNRFPFMAAPAHLIQLMAQQGAGVSIPAGNINWDVPFPRALDLARRTGAHVLAGFPFEPIILAELARAQGLDPARDLALDTFFLGGSPLPKVLQQRIEKVWGARVIELYGSTETMLLGTSCLQRSLHLESSQAYVEILKINSDNPASEGEIGRLIVTTLSIEGSPLIRFDTGDRVRRLAPCGCGDPRQSIVVMGREGDEIEIDGHQRYPYEIIEAAAAAANALESSIFFTVVLPDRLLIRIESEKEDKSHAYAAIKRYLGGMNVEIECADRGLILDTETLSRSPSVYKPVLISDWRAEMGRQILSIDQGMIEWPSLSFAEGRSWLNRTIRRSLRSRRLRREI